jgi:hypothetical protein
MAKMSEEMHSISTENNFERVQSWYLTACPNSANPQQIYQNTQSYILILLNKEEKYFK